MPNGNEAQQVAIKHCTGAMLTLAGPGSGKTFTISQRIKYLIEEHHINPNQIFVISFTKASAVEMQERFQNIVNQPYPVHFGTFHSIFFYILKQTYHYQFDNIITEKEKKEYLNILLRKYIEDDRIDNEFIGRILKDISFVKNSSQIVLEEENYTLPYDVFLTLFEEYSRYMKNERKLDFDDMVLLCLHMLRERKDILKQWQKQFQFVLIDEVQDINTVQYEVIRLLAQPENNIFAVGDDDQSIYGFRGARPEFMMDFQKDYPSAKKILLNINYRSTGNIVQASLKVIAENQVRMEKEIAANQEEGKPVSIHKALNNEEELTYLLEAMQEHKKKGELSQAAVIYRTNSQIPALVQSLTRNQIPFCTKEKITNIYEHFIAQDLLSYLKIANGEVHRKHFFRVMNKPRRYLEREAFPTEHVQWESLGKYYQHTQVVQNHLQKWEYDTDKIRKMEPYAGINYIRKGIGYDEYLKAISKSKKQQFEEYKEIAEQVQKTAKEFSTMSSFFEYIDAYSVQLSQNSGKNNSRKNPGVSLMTMHASKGLEYDFVYLPSLNEGILPHKKSVTQEQIEEERRMFYVGMTRAKKELYLSYITGTKEKPEVSSRFLQPILPL